jgi:hypothetical protein
VLYFFLLSLITPIALFTTLVSRSGSKLVVLSVLVAALVPCGANSCLICLKSTWVGYALTGVSCLAGFERTGSQQPVRLKTDRVGFYSTDRTGSSFAQIINLLKFKQEELIFVLLVKTEMFTTEFRARHRSSQVTKEHKSCNLVVTRQGRSGSSGTERLRPFSLLLSTGRHPLEAQGSTRHTNTQHSGHDCYPGSHTS